MGLMVLVYGLAIAPVLHVAVGHTGSSHGHVHRADGTHVAPGDADPLAPEQARDTDGKGHAGHGRDGHKHLTGSVEHLAAVAATWVVVRLPRVRLVTWVTEAPRSSTRAPGSPLRPTAMPQGP
ncbi:hypothetical protein LZ198_34595 [Myxococcus sp. K15C18031901]|uniref:hypothetical protein n=1 Tax=Myxococcus dinghuensis TaxID=2906761 RepID=UPI0020A7F80F|nr:hypothetical protein [Myxococcus dinghuensis]MCP3104016.1 hypothetical protein [Myxococcus dinghuensis]